MVPTRKLGGRLTEPTLPDKVICETDGIRIIHYYRSGDHAPPHLHVLEDDRQETRIGQGGRPLKHSPQLTARQEEVVVRFRSLIRKAIRKIGRWHWYNQK